MPRQLVIPPLSPNAPRVGQRVGDTQPQSRQTVGWEADGTPIYEPVTAAPAAPSTATVWDAEGKPITAPAAPAPNEPQKPLGFIENLWAGINPAPLIAALNDSTSNPNESAMLRGAGAPPGLGNVIRGIVGAQQGEWQKAKDAYEKGDYGNAIMYALSTAAPIAGPTVTNFGETIKEGDYTGALGQVASMAGPGALAKRVLPKVPITPAMRARNPVTRAATEFAEQRGIPLDAGTVTGNPVVRSAQYIADRTIPGSIVAGKATAAQQDALASTGRQLAKEVDPRGPSTPVTAGEAVRGKVSGDVTRLHGEATQHYDALRALEPSNQVDVVVGYKDSPSGLVKGSVPIIERMAFPVDMTPVKAALKPMWDRMRRQMAVTQQQASPGLKAIENIMTGPDTAPASIVDLDLSAIKEIARGAARPELRDIGQGLAANAVSKLDAAVQAAVAKGGPDATKALMSGRKATRAKYLTQEVLDEINAEPVRAFQMATAPRDASIGKLRDLQRIAPDELPKIGRAFVDDIMDTATKEGGFTKAGSALAKWQNLGQQTKNMLFSSRMQAELDRFFVLAKRASETPNPSGTAGTAFVGGLVIDPLSAVMAQFPGYAVSKLFRSPRGIKVLADGFKANLNPVTQKAWLGTVGALLNQEKE